MAAGVIVALSSIWTNAGAVNITMNLAASVPAFILLRFTGKEKKLSYRVSCWIIVVAVFIVVFPAMFFTAGHGKLNLQCRSAHRKWCDYGKTHADGKESDYTRLG
jgi:phosphotransferase system  glucose/maltose/N-acetylglucosamine-specific IIC component